LLHLIVENGKFLHIDISRGSAVTHLWCGGMFDNNITNEPAGERILENGQQLAKILAKL